MFEQINKWKDKIIHYVEVRVRLFQINVIERVGHTVGTILFSIIGIFLFFSILIFIGFGLAEWFTVLANGSRVAGYFMAGGAYVVLLLILFGLRRPIVRGFAGMFIKILTDDDEKKKNDTNN